MSTITSAFSAAKHNFVKIRGLRNKPGKAISDKAEWPSPQDSVGTRVRKISGKIYWTTKGPGCPVDKMFDDIWPVLNQYLEAHTDPAPTIVFWSVFMVGPVPERTIPTIVVCCEDEKYRKAVAKSIRESKILEAYAGFSTAHLPEPPEDNGPLVLLASSAPPKDATIPEHSTQENEFQYRVYATSKDLGSGSSILVESDGSGVGERATIGGGIQIFGQTYFMTAAHPFMSDMAPRSLKKPIHGNLGRIHSEHVGELYSSSTIQEDAKQELDYALIRPKYKSTIPASGALVSPIIMESCVFPLYTRAEEFGKLHRKAVCAATEVGYIPTRIRGSISTTPGMIRVPHTRAFQKVFAVKLTHLISRGISGSWVVDDTGTGSLHGHMIAGHDKGQSAYIVPMCDVFDDINRVISGKLQVPKQAANVERSGSTSISVKHKGPEKTILHPTSNLLWTLTPAVSQMPPDTTKDWNRPASLLPAQHPFLYPSNILDLPPSLVMDTSSKQTPTVQPPSQQTPSKRADQLNAVGLDRILNRLR